MDPTRDRGRKLTGTKKRLALALLASGLLLSGCMLSTQDGQRGHVNDKHPDVIAFHFDSMFNHFMLWGRVTLSVVIVAVVLWIGSASRASTVISLLISLVLVAGTVTWHLHDSELIRSYRIEILPDGFRVRMPDRPELALKWRYIDGADMKGRTETIELAKGPKLTKPTEWTHLEVLTRDRKTHRIPLEQLGAEQRGQLWRGIVRMAELEEMDGRPKTMLLPGPRSQQR
jgi:hypothetical protein